MNADRQVEFFRRIPERLVIRVVEHLVVVRIGPDEGGAHAELVAGKPHLLDRQLNRMQGQHGNAKEAIRIGLTVIRQPPVVSMV